MIKLTQVAEDKWMMYFIIFNFNYLFVYTCVCSCEMGLPGTTIKKKESAQSTK